jgi:hypothetical protein
VSGKFIFTLAGYFSPDSEALLSKFEHRMSTQGLQLAEVERGHVLTVNFQSLFKGKSRVPCRFRLLLVPDRRGRETR